MTSDNPLQDSRSALDEAARHAHAASLGQLSPRVQAQLAQRRRAALTQHSQPASIRAWPMLAIGSAAALTLAVGLFVLRGNGEIDAARRPDTVVTAPAPAIDTAPHATTATADPETATRTTSHTAPAIASSDAVDQVTPVGAAIERVSAESIAIEDDALPAEWLAAEFSTADEALGLGAQEESPDFYLWLGSQDAQASVTESL